MSKAGDKSAHSSTVGLILYLSVTLVGCFYYNRLTDDGQNVILTLLDTATAELQQRADLSTDVNNIVTVSEEKNSSQKLNFTPTVLVTLENKSESASSAPSEQYTVRAEPKIIGVEVKVGNKTDIVNELAPKVNESKEDSPTAKEDLPPAKEDPEDIPSFSEWTQKQLEEAEKKKEKVNTSSQNQQTNKPPPSLKLRSKNYASPDCGAKIVAANPEAISAGSILSPSRDEYKLNTCTSRIWFVVELCEAIQAKKIDLANFELFSSSPKDFAVSVSDRFPSREWSSVGQFQAKDERDIQSFNLHPHLFGKFIKVEMLSHWGSEHFCPISLFRVYGTSEFEVLETEDQLIPNEQDDDDDETLDSYSGETANNLFGSARDAVLSIVKKAAEVLVKSGDNNQTIREEKNKSRTTPLINTCSTPSHLVVCDNCSDVLFGNLYELLSCKNNYLQGLIEMPSIKNVLYNTDICVQYGLNFFSRSVDCVTETYSSYVANFFSPKYIAALCNVLAVSENKVLLNTSNQCSNISSINVSSITNNINHLDDKDIVPTACPSDEKIEAKTCGTQTNAEEASIIDDSFVENSIELQIKPTKTLSKDSKIESHSQTLETTIVSTAKENSVEPNEFESKSFESATIEPKLNQVQNKTEEVVLTTTMDGATNVTPEPTISQPTDSSETFEIGHDQLDKLLSELNMESDNSHSAATTTVPPANNVPQQAQKESVFLRLANRIKALERNMSLSGQYLEELSRRYKKQVEEMQRVFEKKLQLLNEENKRQNERRENLEKQVETLVITVNSLLSERDSLWRTATLLGQFLLMETCITCLLLYFCWRNPENKNPLKTKNQKNVTEIKRRKSIDAIGHEPPIVQRRRRPSEETLRISGTYKDLLISDDGNLTKAEKRRRRKRNALLRSQSVVACKDNLIIENNDQQRRASSSEMARKISGNFQPVSLVNGDLSPTKIEEIPFVLEESEHTFVEPVTYFRANSDESDYILPKPNLQKVTKNGKMGVFKSHSEIFMTTAMQARSKRNSVKKLKLFKTDSGLDNSFENSSQKNGFSDRDDQTSLDSNSSKKDKKTGAFKKIFKKVFD